MSARSDSSASAPGTGPHDDDPPAHGKRLEAARKVRGTDELEHDVHAAGLRELAGLGAEVGQRLAVGPRVREHAHAGCDAELHGRRADAARCAVHEKRLAEREPSPGEEGVVGGDERLGDGGGLAIGQVVGDAGDVPLVHRDRVGQPASADEPEHAVAGPPRGHRLAAGDHRSGDLEPRNVGRRAGRGGVVPGALGDVGRVETGVRGAHEHLRRQRHRVGPFADGHHLRAAGTEERHRDHGLA